MPYFRNRFTLIVTIGSAVLVGLSYWVLFLKLDDLPNEVAFWYTMQPINRLAPAGYLWAIPSLAAGLSLFNIGIGWWLFRRWPAASQLATGGALLLSLLACIATIQIVLIYTTLP